MKKWLHPIIGLFYEKFFLSQIILEAPMPIKNAVNSVRRCVWIKSSLNEKHCNNSINILRQRTTSRKTPKKPRSMKMYTFWIFSWNIFTGMCLSLYYRETDVYFTKFCSLVHYNCICMDLANFCRNEPCNCIAKYNDTHIYYYIIE